MAKGKKKYERKTRKLRYPNGYGSVHLLSNPEKRRNPYIVQVPDGIKTRILQDGSLKSQYAYKTLCYVKTWEEGDQILRDYNNRKKFGDGCILTKYATFDEIHAIVLPRYTKDRSISLITAYKAAYKHLHKIYHIPINEIKTANIQAIFDDLRENKGRGSKTISNMKHICNQVFSYAYENDLVDKNYASFLKIGAADKPKEKKIFTREQIELLFQNDKDPIVNTVLIYIFTGMRISELLLVKRCDVHIKERYLVGGVKTKAGKNRVIPIHRYIERYISDWYAKETEYLITDKNGRPYSKATYRFQFMKVMEKFNIRDITNHCCRHTLSTMFDNANVNRVAAQKILGHVSSDLDERVYIHKSIERLIEAMDMVSLDAL